MKNFKYCPNCKNKIKSKANFYECENCETKIYKHSYPTASVLPIKDGKVLMAIRAQEPHKGELDAIGGFCNYGEDPAKAAIREAKEETNLDIALLDILGIYIDDYPHNGDVIKTFNVIYVAEIVGGKMKAMDDVASLDWYDINKTPDVKISFKSHKKALGDLQKWIKFRGISKACSPRYSRGIV